MATDSAIRHGRLSANGQHDFAERRAGRAFAPDAFGAREEIRLGSFYCGNECRRHCSIVEYFQRLSAGDRLVENRGIAVDVIERCSRGAIMRAGREAAKRSRIERAGFLNRPLF